MLVIGFLVFLFGILADLVATNRNLHEETLYYLKRLALDRRNGVATGEAVQSRFSSKTSDRDIRI